MTLARLMCLALLQASRSVMTDSNFLCKFHCWNARVPRSLLPMSRSITVNESVMEEWDSNMRVMRNEIFSMCGLLTEAEDELIAAIERTDEGVHYVTSTLTPLKEGRQSALPDGISSSNNGDSRESRNGAENLKREDYLQCHVGLERCHASLERSMTTCQNCILALEDDFDSISEQVS